MPNIASVLKTEVARLTRKEIRLQIEPLRKQLLAQRKTIAALKQDIDKLQRGAKTMSKSKGAAVAVARTAEGPVTQSRFSASGLLKLRTRLGLSRDAFAPLLGASPQALVKWETGVNRPRAEFMEKLAIVRGLSNRQVQELLEQHAPKGKAKTSRKAASSKKMTKKATASRAAPKNDAKKAHKKAAKPTVPAKRDRPAKGSVRAPAAAQVTAA